MKSNFFQTNGIKLHTMCAGRSDGPLLIFLHGFPEFWYGWKNQITYFAKKGFCVLAPDQRGYNLSDKPRGVKAYQVKECVQDIVELIQSQNRKKAIVVGHDWGGAIAWTLAAQHPTMIEKLIILNSPHPTAFRKQLSSSFSQMKKSWYMFFFQLPWLPEYVLKRKNWALSLKLSLKTTAHPQAFSEADFATYRQAWNQPKAFQAMIHWYRNLFKLNTLPLLFKDLSIQVPTLLLWGKKDPYLSSTLAEMSIQQCHNGKLIFLEEASHWLQHETPEQVNHLIHQFIQSTE